MKKSEAQEQTALFQWAEMQKGKYPELQLMFAIPNGGSRHVLEAVNLKKQGVKAGVPDICLPVARVGFNGLYIELKIKGGRVKANQKEWIDELNNQKYKAVVCYGFEESKEVILDYIIRHKEEK